MFKINECFDNVLSIICAFTYVSGVCREDKRFIDVFVGFPGRVHDARVFGESTLFDIGAQLCGSQALLGDSAYPLLSYLLTPYKNYGNLTVCQAIYNVYHSRTRIVIEQAFGLLKGTLR